MMMVAIFWILVALLAYSYVGYGILIILLAALRPDRRPVPPETPLQATVLIPAFNEEAEIGRKLETVLNLDPGPHALRTIVLSDGSTDRTNAIVAGFADRGIELIAIPQNVGKINALNQVLDTLPGDVVILTDANSMLAKDTVRHLLRPFGDPRIGGVCGAIAVPPRGRNWLGRVESLYWTYDHALKTAESRLAGAVTAQGSVYAIRRNLLQTIPPGSADDLVISLRVVLAGQRIAFEPRAVAHEKITAKLAGEFGRRVRSTEQGWRSLMMFRTLLDPRRYGLYAFQLGSHKGLRRLTPFLLVLTAAANLAVLGHGLFYALTAAGQGLIYGAALLGFLVPSLRKLPPVSLSLFFVMGHAAMGLGVVNAMRGKQTHQWTPVR